VPAIDIEWQSFPPIRVEKELTAKSMTSPSPGTYVFDFGQNLAGVARLRAQGPAGTVVQLRFAELVNSDGTIYTANLRNAEATDRMILAGNGLEEFQPNFTFHGFRYVEVTGLREKPGLDSVKAVVFHTDAAFTTELRTGSKMIDQLWSNILWGQRSNFVGVPTDCPQRDERLGWTGDAQVFWRAAVYNMGIEAFSRKFAGDLRVTQTSTPMYAQFAPGVFSENDGFAAGWADAGVIIPWTAWVQYGDKRILEQNWDAIEKYLNAIEAANPDYLWRHNFGIAYGDWLSPEGTTAEDLIATAYWAYDSSLMAQMAHALGRAAEEQRYRNTFEKIKAAFNQAYVHDDGRVTASAASVAAIPAPGDARGTILNESQTGYVLALHMNLLPEELRAKAGDLLVKLIEANHWHLGTGFLGTPYLLAALTETGHSDVAYRLLLSTEYPSWGYLVEHGATPCGNDGMAIRKKAIPA
jgi:alpha-L-rhamnosidase